MNTVYCPLIKNRIDGINCNIVCDVVDGYFNRDVLPEGLFLGDEEKEICNNCRYHYPINEGELKDGRKVIIIEKKDGTLMASDDLDPENWDFFVINADDVKKAY